MTLKDLFTEIKDLFIDIINTPISELFLYLVIILIVSSFLVWAIPKILGSETGFMYLSKEEKDKKNQKFLKRSSWFFGILIIFNIVMWTYLSVT
tara:strand:+ start:115 stop:396 length:282 start_codon:yes stop_codon:yes gene_type:complete